MAKNAATESQLGKLHSTVTTIFQRILDDYLKKLSMSENMAENISGAELSDEIVTALLNEGFMPNPAMLSAITKFLKDNEVSYDSEQLDELGELERKLAERKASRPDFSNVTQLPLTGTDD